MRKAGLIGLTLLTLACFAPAIAVTPAMSVAGAAGCQLDEGSVHPCRVGSLDLGDTLYGGFVLGWFVLVTWPGMLLCLGVWGWLGMRGVGRGWASRRAKMSG